MENIKTYKGVGISFDAYDGKFLASINGTFKRFASLKSATNAIDKDAVVDFKPVEVLLVESKGYSPQTFYIKQIKIVGYNEERGYSRGHIRRFYVLSNGEKLSIRNAEIFSLKDRKKLEANIKEENEQEIIECAAEKRVEKLNDQRRKMEIDLDPHPELT